MLINKSDFLIFNNINNIKENFTNINTIIYVYNEMYNDSIIKKLKEKFDLVNMLFVPDKFFYCPQVKKFIKKFCLYNNDDIYNGTNLKCKNCCHINEIKVLYFKLNNIVKILKNNEIYRLSDGFRGSTIIVNNIIKDTNYDNTILKKYLQKNNKKKNYKNLFDEIVNHKNKYNIETPDDNSLVVHLRTGDCLRFFATNENVQKKILNNIEDYCNKNKNITHIILVTALHYGVNQNSTLYSSNKIYRYNDKSKDINLNAILNFCNRIKKPVLFKSSDKTDEDIIYLTLAKNLITTEGGFSRLINELNNKFVNVSNKQPNNVSNKQPNNVSNKELNNKFINILNNKTNGRIIIHNINNDTNDTNDTNNNRNNIINNNIPFNFSKKLSPEFLEKIKKKKLNNNNTIDLNNVFKKKLINNKYIKLHIK